MSSETQPLRADDQNIETQISKARNECCSTTTKKMAWGFGIATVLILIGTMIYLFFPRYPKIGFNEVEIDSSRHVPQGSRKILGSLIEHNSTVDLGLNVHLYANSTLYFDLEVKNITVKGYMKVDNGDYVYVGTGYLKDSIVIPKRSNFKDFTMPFTLSYNTKKSHNKSDDVFNQFLERCGIDGQPKRNIRLKYIARADIPLLSWTGYTPKFIKEIFMPCPLNLHVVSTVRKMLNIFH